MLGGRERVSGYPGGYREPDQDWGGSLETLVGFGGQCSDLGDGEGAGVMGKGQGLWDVAGGW